MTCVLRFLPEVEDDAIAGYGWYEAKAPGLGEDFLRVFYGGAVDISENPLLYQTVHGEIRRRLFRRFPYAAYFIVEGEEVVGLGLFHCARDPRTVSRELRRRDRPGSP